MKINTSYHLNPVLKKIQSLMDNIPQLHKESKTCGLFCYYRYYGKRKKLIFYINPRRTEVIFVISHRATDILETFPMLAGLADEVKTSVLKIKIKKIEDIETKAIRYIIEMIVKHLET